MYAHDTLGRHSIRSLQSLQSIKTAYSGRSLHSNPSIMLNVDRVSLSGLSVVAPSDVVIVQPSGQAAYHHHIDKAISSFYVEFDDCKETYKPGDTISGTVIMDVWSPLEIRYVEFVIQGRGAVRLVTSSTSTALREKPRIEVYLEKKIMLMMPRGGAPHMVLNPGRYVSKFSYNLPDNLPPSVAPFEMGRGYMFGITYYTQANICDSLRDRRVIHSQRYVRIIKASRRNFYLEPLHDWQSIPSATEAIVHAEQLQLFCAGSRSDPTSVLVSLNRSVYPIGDHINISVEVYTPTGKKVKKVTAELHQLITKKKGRVQKFERVLITARDQRNNKHEKRQEDDQMLRSKLSIPLPDSVVPSYLPYCHLLTITYTMHITVAFKGLAGKMTVSLPLKITPASTEERLVDNPDLPSFSKPIKQFPYFSKSPKDLQGDGESTMAVDSSAVNNSSIPANYTLQPTIKSSKDSNDPQVTASYKTGWCCCNCCIGCCGVGIYD